MKVHFYFEVDAFSESVGEYATAGIHVALDRACEPDEEARELLTAHVAHVITAELAFESLRPITAEQYAERGYGVEAAS